MLTKKFFALFLILACATPVLAMKTKDDAAATSDADKKDNKKAKTPLQVYEEEANAVAAACKTKKRELAEAVGAYLEKAGKDTTGMSKEDKATHEKELAEKKVKSDAAMVALKAASKGQPAGTAVDNVVLTADETSIWAKGRFYGLWIPRKAGSLWSGFCAHHPYLGAIGTSAAFTAVVYLALKEQIDGVVFGEENQDDANVRF